MNQATKQRALPVYFMLDASGSMRGSKIQSMNYAVQITKSTLIELAKSNPQIPFYVRTLQFSDRALFQHQHLTPLCEYDYQDLHCGGLTSMGEALLLLSNHLKEMEQAKVDIYCPVIIMITDGKATDDVDRSLGVFMSTAFGKNAMRFAITIGDRVDKEFLTRFIGRPNISVLSVEDDIRQCFIENFFFQAVRGVV